MADHMELMKQCEIQLQKVGVNQKGGKKYMMVKDRMTFFRQAYGLEYGVSTELLHSDGKSVCVKAQVIDQNGRVVGSGMAEEQRGSSNVNKASALENCESSAIGRALASLGLHGGEYPTLDEIESDRRSSTIIDQRKATKPKMIADEIPLNEAEAKPDYKSWVDEAISGFQYHKDMAKHQSWVDFNEETINELPEAEVNALISAWQKRKDELTNG